MDWLDMAQDWGQVVGIYEGGNELTVKAVPLLAWSGPEGSKK